MQPFNLYAQTQTAWTADAGMPRKTNATHELFASVGQGQPTSCIRRDDGTTVYQGFLSGAVLRPDLDHDNDGLADEEDLDNDGEGIQDLIELSGSSFNPDTVTDVNLPDTDHDGASDAIEVDMLTNPLDSNSVFSVTNIEVNSPTEVTLQWQGRSGEDYQIYYSTNLMTDSVTNLLGAPLTAPAGGTPDWYEVAVQHSITSINNETYIRIKRVP